jgi:membrane protease YdiL (CAAX protease family)
MDDRRDEMFCPSCGERMRRSVNFCPNCGEPNRKQDSARWGPSQESDPEADEPGERREAHRGPAPESGGETAGGTPAPEPGRGPDTGRGPAPDPGRGPDTGHGPAPEPGQPPGQGPAGPGGGAPPGGASTAELPQWRAYLPAQLRASNESGFRVTGVAVGLAAASILVPTIAGSLVVALLLIVAGDGFVDSLPDIAFFGGVILLVLAQFAWFAGFGLWYLRRRGFDRERIVSYLGIKRPTGRQLALVVGTAIGMVIAAGLVNQVLVQVVELLGFEIQPAENESTQVLENNPSPLLLLGGVALMLFVVGPAEELLFRGVIQGRLRERLSPVTAILIASAVFGSVHVLSLAGGSGAAGLLLTIAVLSTVAIVLGSLYEYTGNLVVVALTHGLYNSILITMLYLATVYDIDTEEALLLPDILTVLPL